MTPKELAELIANFLPIYALLITPLIFKILDDRGYFNDEIKEEVE